MKGLILILICFCTSIYAQSYEPVFFQVKVTERIIKKEIINGDTVSILEKKSGCKFVDSLKLHSLDKKHDYFFILPDSLPNGKYAVFYNDKKRNPAFIVSYVNGSRNGSFKNFRYNGKIEREGFYLNNCFDKVLTEYSELGRISAVSNFENCLLEGSSFRFATTGEFYMMITYHKGKKEGKVITYTYDKKHFPKVQYNFDYKDDVRIKSNYN